MQMDKVNCGKFIVLEGCEGGGKSTAAKTIADFLGSEFGVQPTDIIHTREPGGTPIAEEIRKILKKPRTDDSMCSEAELLLMYASRVQLVNTVIKPALAAGKWVIGDRHDLSTVAYQGAGRGMDLNLINTIRTTVLGDFKPDLTLILDLPPEIGLERARGRGALDRFELEDISFFKRIRACFLAEAQKDPAHLVVVDATKPLGEVTASIQNTLKHKLGAPK
ncbi:MAG: dTMP kinase [Succinivibrionaceae bacterium]|nr:dTMP kinase [Succinivibrionaceae bacterium]